MKKNRAAVSLGRRGGNVRSSRMTPEQRSDAARLAAQERWKDHQKRAKRKPKPRIRQNRWDNWFGYIGRHRVIAFGATSELTQEQAASIWLATQLENTQ